MLQGALSKNTTEIELVFQLHNQRFIFILGFEAGVLTILSAIYQYDINIRVDVEK